MYVNKRNSGSDRKADISHSSISIQINPFFTASLTYSHISESAFLQLSSLTKRELLNPGFLWSENHIMGTLAMECSFHKATSALLVSWIPQLMLRVGAGTVHVTSLSVPGVHRFFNIPSHEAFFEFMVLTELLVKP